jgi:hypothetical protein
MWPMLMHAANHLGADCGFSQPDCGQACRILAEDDFFAVPRYATGGVAGVHD